MTPLAGLVLAQATAGLTEACGDTPGVVCKLVYDLTDNDRLAQVVEWVVAKPLKVLLVVAIAFVASRLIRRGIRRLVERLIAQREQRARAREEEEVEDGRFAVLRDRARAKASLIADQTERGKQRAQALGTVLRSLSSVVIYTLATVMVLAEFGFNLGPLAAGAGIAGIAIGFGAQTLVRDFLGGIFMLVEDQYGVGDIVDLGDATGVVEEVRLRTTRLRALDGTVWFVPNGEIRRVGNKSQQWARAVLDVEVAYGTDLDRAARVIKEVADGIWRDALPKLTVLEEPEIWGVESLGDSSVAIRLVFKVEPGEQWATAREARKRIKAAFDAAGIEIPFPQRAVWLRTPADEAPSPGDPGPDEARGTGAS